MTIKHAQGELTLDKAPERVVVLDLGVLDSIASLDLSSAVAGVPKTSTTYPDSLSEFQSDTYKDVGTVKEPDEEAIADIDPDLVIVAKRTSKAYETLSANFPTIDMTVKPTTPPTARRRAAVEAVEAVVRASRSPQPQRPL